MITDAMILFETPSQPHPSPALFTDSDSCKAILPQRSEERMIDQRLVANNMPSGERRGGGFNGA